MKKTLPILFLFLGLFLFSQKVSTEILLYDTVSIRSIQVWDNKVWYAGTDSKFGFVDLKNPQHKKQIKLSKEKLQFRTLAQNKDHFYAINIESPAYFFAIDKKYLTSSIVFKDTAKTAFYDALHFVHDNLAYAFSDADTGGYLKLALFKNGRWSFLKNKIILNHGEAAFAASNTNIASTKNYVWIATGGTSSRILRLNLKHGKTDIFTPPFIQGESSQGMYSIDFYNDQFGVAAGGDYTKQSENVNNIAITYDGGKNWEIQASGQNAGYMTCVKIKPQSGGKEMVAVGDQHISYSSDYGKTWNIISDEKNLYVAEWLDTNTLVFAGKNKIIKMRLKF